MDLTLVSRSWTWTRFELMDGARRLGNLDLSWTGGNATAELDGQRYRLRRRVFGGRTVLEQGGRAVLTGEKEHVFTRAVRFVGAEGSFRLEPVGGLSTSHRLLRAHQPVGVLTCKGVLRRVRSGRFDDDLSLELCAFTLFHLALVEAQSATPVGSVS